MREPGLQKTTALSLALHLTAFLIAFLFLKQSNHIIISPTYTVSLVSSDILTGIDKGKNIDAPDMSKESVTQADIPKKNLKEISKGKEMVEEKISAIAAKKKVEKIVRLRSIISLKASGDNRRVNSQITGAPVGKGTMFDDYYSKIIREIWQQWVFPDTGQKDLEAIISVRIKRDGAITAQRIEKSSGNLLFDRSAIKALAKASPLPPPPYEMEIGVRFYP
jgi:colicin import membrane protein